MTFEQPELPKSKRGFASMNQQRRRYVASLGGKKAHANGNAHIFDKETSRAAVAKAWEVRRARAAKQNQG